MRKYILFLLLAAATFAYGLEYPFAVKTSVDGGRFEIIQSPVARRVTFKLDKLTGKTFQLVQVNKKDDYTWKEIHSIGVISDDGKKEGEFNYQIFFGGYSLKDCFLINIHTGKTWQLGEDKIYGFAWVEME